MKSIRHFLLFAAGLMLLVWSCSKKSDPSAQIPDPTPVLAITGFSPASATVGASVTITGSAFGTDANAVGIKFGNSAVVQPSTVTATQLTVVVPQDATSGYISVIIGSKTVMSSESFAVTTSVIDYSTYNTLRYTGAANLSVARSLLACAATGTKIVFAGGSTDGHGGGASDVVDIFDVITNSWTTAQLSEPRYLLSAAGAGNKIVFAGGVDKDGGYSKTVDIFDVVTNKWTTAQLSEGRSRLAAAASGDKILFVGGAKSLNETSKAVDIYDVKTDTWSISQLSFPRRDLAAVGISGKIIVAGGNQGLNNMVGAIEIYNIATNTWSISNAKVYCQICAAAANRNKIVFADQGFLANIYDIAVDTNADAFLNINAGECVTSAGTKIVISAVDEQQIGNIYDAFAGTWSTFHVKEARFSFAAGAIADKMIYAGGINNNGVLKSVEIYT